MDRTENDPATDIAVVSDFIHKSHLGWGDGIGPVRSEHIASVLIRLIKNLRNSDFGGVFNVEFDPTYPTRSVPIMLRSDDENLQTRKQPLFYFDTRYCGIVSVEKLVRYTAYPSLLDLRMASPKFEHAKALEKAYSSESTTLLTNGNLMALLPNVMGKVKKTFATYKIEPTSENIASYLSFVLIPFDYSISSMNIALALSEQLEFNSMEAAICYYVSRGWSQPFVDFIAQANYKSPIVDITYIFQMHEIYTTMPLSWFTKMIEGGE